MSCENLQNLQVSVLCGIKQKKPSLRIKSTDKLSACQAQNWIQGCVLSLMPAATWSSLACSANTLDT